MKLSAAPEEAHMLRMATSSEEAPLTVQFLGNESDEGYPVVLTMTFPTPGTKLHTFEPILTDEGDGVVTLRFPPEVYRGHADFNVVLPG